jgi:hypothetical protein
VRAVDVDGDGDLDVYVANDSDPNYLYRNDGAGRFAEIGVTSMSAFDGNGAAQASMGIATGDTDGDVLVDILVSNFADDFSTLYKGLGGGFFADVSRETGVGPATYAPLSWGAAMADFDNDGDLDIASASGHIYPQVDRHPELGVTYAQKNQLLENRGGHFHEATAAAGPGFALARAYRGLAVGDYDDDGRVDILLSALDAPPVLLRNESSAGAWITVACEGSPIGTKVSVRVGGHTMVRDIAAGDSYVSSHDPRLHFGLGAAEVADEVVVRWPDGTETRRAGVRARQVLVVRKG